MYSSYQLITGDQVHGICLLKHFANGDIAVTPAEVVNVMTQILVLDIET